MPGQQPEAEDSEFQTMAVEIRGSWQDLVTSILHATNFSRSPAARAPLQSTKSKSKHPQGCENTCASCRVPGARVCVSLVGCIAVSLLSVHSQFQAVGWMVAAL